MSTLPNKKPKSERNRFSLILQRGSSTGKKTTDERAVSPSLEPSPVACSSFTSLSPRGSRMLASQHDYLQLTTRDNEQFDVSIPTALHDLDDAEKAQLMKKARKLSRVFGEAVVLRQPLSPAQDTRSSTISDVEYCASRSNTPSIPSPGEEESLQQRNVLRLSRQSAIPSQIPFAHAIPLEIHSSPTSSLAFHGATNGDACLVVTSGRDRFARLVGVDLSPRIDGTPPNSHGDASSCRSRSLSVNRSSLDLDLSMPAELGFDKSKSEDRKSLLSLRHKLVHDTDFATNVDAVTVERDRFLNVKRARKMAQLFGHDPPMELFHIARDINRHSLSSICTESSYAVSSVKVPIPELFTSVSLRGTVSPTEAMETARDHQVPSFQERRRRAAKLAQFFGVGCHDITPSLTMPSRTFVAAEPTSFSTKDDTMLQVDIKVSGRSRIWGKSNLREVDIVDARDRLRTLKSK